jgi:hypothetical protein
MVVMATVTAADITTKKQIGNVESTVYSKAGYATGELVLDPINLVANLTYTVESTLTPDNNNETFRNPLILHITDTTTGIKVRNITRLDNNGGGPLIIVKQGKPTTVLLILQPETTITIIITVLGLYGFYAVRVITQQPVTELAPPPV